MLKSMKCN